MPPQQQVWGKARVKEHFNIDNSQYQDLCKRIKGHLEGQRLLGKSFKTLIMRKHLYDCVKANYPSYPSFVTDGQESEAIQVLISMAQQINFSWQRAHKILDTSHRISTDGTPPASPYQASTAQGGTSAAAPQPETPLQQQLSYYSQYPPPGMPMTSDSPMAIPPPRPIPGHSQAHAHAPPPHHASPLPPPHPAPTPTFQQAPAARTFAFEHRTILVRNLIDTRKNGLCTVKDMCRPGSSARVPPDSPSSSTSERGEREREREREQQPHSSPAAPQLTIDDLDYDKWLEFLVQECGYDPTWHVVSYTIGNSSGSSSGQDSGDKVLIKSRWSWRAAMQEIFLAGGDGSSRFIFELMPIDREEQQPTTATSQMDSPAPMSSGESTLLSPTMSNAVATMLSMSTSTSGEGQPQCQSQSQSQQSQSQLQIQLQANTAQSIFELQNTASFPLVDTAMEGLDALLPN